MITPNLIIQHYEQCWAAKGEPKRWKLGPTWQLPPDFQILAFAPRAKRQMWTYATCGMSCQGDAPPLEIHLFSPVQTEDHVELLTVLAHYHLTGAYLDLGHIVNFGRPWLPESTCHRGLISLPYLDGPKLEWLTTGTEKVRFLWLLPITDPEAALANEKGLDALEERFEATGFNYLDPLRNSAI